MQQLATRGVQVVILDVNASQDETPGTIYIGTDIGSSDPVRDGVARSATALGGIDIVINNAGIGASGSVTANPDDE